jgi:nucleoside-diphosphate-sugar epimerase
MAGEFEGTGGLMRVAVTGGTGFVGSHVVELLLARGHEVNCLVVPSRGTLWLEGASVRFFEGSVTDSSVLPAFLEGCEAIVNIAGLTRARNEELFLSVNRDGAVKLVEAALSLPRGPRQIISMSSEAAMGPTPEGEKSVETDPMRPLTPYGRSKMALEVALKPYYDDGRMRCTFIRAPGVYGPRDRDFLQYFKLVKHGLRIIVGDRSVMSLVYVKTLAAAIESCLGNPAAYDQTFFVADEGEYDWDDFSSMVEKALGKKTLRIQVPEWFVAVAAFCAEIVKPFCRRPPLLDRNKLLEVRQHRWVLSTAKAKSLLRFEPVAATSDAIAETARWYLDHEWI